MTRFTTALRTPKAKKISAAGVSTLGAAAVMMTITPGTAQAASPGHAPTGAVVQTAAKSAPATFESAVAKKDPAAVKKAKADKAKVEKAIAAETTKADAGKRAQDSDKASRSAERAAAKAYPDNLEGWIQEARDIMKKEGIPGSYDGIKRNIIRESAGDPNAVNDWDINAQKGIPSKGLLQVIQPTFDQYHVKGTAKKLTDPVANIVAACNYAADRYGSMDNVDSAY